MPVGAFQYHSDLQQATSNLLYIGSSRIGIRAVGRPHNPTRGVVANQSLLNATV